MSLASDQTEAALKQNINLKIEVQQCGMKLKKPAPELERELQCVGGSKESERECELAADAALKELRRGDDLLQRVGWAARGT